jgi:hypothetical protein
MATLGLHPKLSGPVTVAPPHTQHPERCGCQILRRCSSPRQLMLNGRRRRLTDEPWGAMSSVSPTNALSARVMLATGMHAQPGVYAVLLGSGVSRSAGVSTGWEIVQHLVQKAAAADNPDDAKSHALAASDPEAWWAQHGEGDLGYSSLLAAIAPSSAARQGLLAEYFDATEDDRQDGRKVPTAAHNAIAELVKAGSIKVIVTTNFDRLMEQALDAVGVTPQVVARSDAVRGVTPLAHAQATVIKLHGDWKDLEFRNTFEELISYPQPWVDLLTQVFNEYGLLISGWSAEWDKALVRVLEATPRRYPLYWDSRSSKSEIARNLLIQQGGNVIKADNADDLFTSLASSVEALTRLAEPPLTTAMAIARLKRALPDPLRRIELSDLIADKLEDLIDTLADTVPASARNYAVVDAYLEAMYEAAKPVLALLTNGVRYDDGTHADVWIDALQVILDRRTTRGNATQVQIFDELRNYPALLALRAMSIEAVRKRNDALLIALLTLPLWDDPLHSGRSKVAADVLHTLNIIDGDVVNNLPRFIANPRGWIFPQSHLIKVALEPFFTEEGLDFATYRDLYEDVEYRTGFVQFLLPDDRDGYHHNPIAGEFLIEERWRYFGNNRDVWAPNAEIRLRENASRYGHGAWNELLGDRSLDDALIAYRELLKKYSRR